jgi:hypothetical protein
MVDGTDGADVFMPPLAVHGRVDIQPVDNSVHNGDMHS